MSNDSIDLEERKQEIMEMMRQLLEEYAMPYYSWGRRKYVWSNSAAEVTYNKLAVELGTIINSQSRRKKSNV